MSESSWKSLCSILGEQFTKEAICNRPRSLKTGFSLLDRILGGGLNAELTILGGNTGLGKSTFALQLAEQVSESSCGIPVLYFSLEMSSEWIAAKAISRRYFKAAISAARGSKISEQSGIAAKALIDPETAGKLSEREWQQLTEIRKSLQGNQNLYIIDQVLSAAKISDIVKRFVEEGAEAGRRTPLVIVDYLQILPPDNSKAGTAKQIVEDSLRTMMDLSHNSKVPVILISSLNRNSYKSPMGHDAFKESGSIEYSADVLLGLQLYACHQKEESWDMDEELDKFPCDVEITVIKQRYGSSGKAVRFKYYAEFDYFEEAASGGPPLSSQTQPHEHGEEAVPSGVITAPPTEQRRTRGIKSQPYYINNTKVANEIRKGAPAGTGVPCQVFADTTTEFEISDHLSCFDCNVADAIYTLYKNDRDTFTPGMILKVLSGDKKQTITAQKRKDITASIEKLRNVHIEINCTAEMRARGKAAEDEEKIISGKFLSVRESGKDKYHLDGVDAMPLYFYGELSTQMIRFPSRLLAVCVGDKKISDTLENINIKRFLIRRLEVIRHPDSSKNSSASKSVARKYMRSISFQESGEMFSEMGICRSDFQSKSAWKHKCQKDYQTVIKILEYYKQIGYITDYQKKSAGGVEILGEVTDPWELK